MMFEEEMVYVCNSCDATLNIDTEIDKEHICFVDEVRVLGCMIRRKTKVKHHEDIEEHCNGCKRPI